MNILSFFLENKGTRQTIAKNTFWLAFSQIASQVLKLVLIIYVARAFGATEYGRFNFALSVATMLNIFSDIGISQIATREFAKNKDEEKYFSPLFTLKIFLSLINLIIILLFSFFVTDDASTRILIWVLGAYISIYSLETLFFSLWQARQKMEDQAKTEIIQTALTLILGISFLQISANALQLSLAYLGAAVITFLIVYIIFCLKIISIRFDIDFAIWKKFLIVSAPIAMAGIFTALYNNFDSVYMGYLGQITQVGWYNAAYKITAILGIPATIISTSFMPALSNFFHNAKEKIQHIWDLQLESTIFIATPLVIGGVVLAEKIIDFIYDASYFQSIVVFQVLIVGTGLFYLSQPLLQILFISNRQKQIFLVWAIAGIVNLILNLILIPLHSLYGACVAMVITIFIMFLVSALLAMRSKIVEILSKKNILSCLISTLATVIMYFLISSKQIINLNILVVIIIGGIVYSICYFLLRKLLFPLIKV